MPDLTNIKAGDEVFVVEQRDRHQVRIKMPHQVSTVKVAKVGREYGYLDDGWRERKFHLADGRSAHGEGNERANGYGFDVYPTDQEYLREQHELSEYLRLKERLCGRHGELIDLSCRTVELIHQILDKESEATDGN